MAGRHLVGLAGPAHWRVGAVLGHALLVEAGWDQGRPDRAGGHAVDPYLPAGQLFGQRAGEGHDGAAGRAVVEQLRAALEGSHRGGVHDRGAFTQVRQRSLSHEDVAEDIGLKRLHQLLLADVGDRLLLMLLGGVVHQDVELAETLEDLRDRAPTELLVADVAGDGQALPTFLADHCGGPSASSCSSR